MSNIVFLMTIFGSWDQIFTVNGKKQALFLRFWNIFSEKKLLLFWGGKTRSISKIFTVNCKYLDNMDQQNIFHRQAISSPVYFFFVAGGAQGCWWWWWWLWWWCLLAANEWPSGQHAKLEATSGLHRSQFSNIIYFTLLTKGFPIHIFWICHKESVLELTLQLQKWQFSFTFQSS